MSKKLQIGDQFPSITLNMINGKVNNIPEDINTPFAILIVFRGKW